MNAMKLRVALVVGACLAVLPLLASAAEQGSAQLASDGATQSADAAQRVSYPAEFFRPYNPVTARDMVVQVPGFRIDEGGAARGFGGTAGNLLLNGNRPSTKNDDAGEILGRIPASQVLRIDLIRGDTAGLNLRGQTVVADVILRTDAIPATRWEAKARTTENTATINPSGSISGTGYAGTTQYTLGLAGGEDRFQQARGTEWLLTSAGAGEERFESADSQGKGYNANFNTETLLRQAVLRFNGRLGTTTLLDSESSERQARLPGFISRRVLDARQSDVDTIELGADAEFPLSASLDAKAIALFNRSDEAAESRLRVLDPASRLLSASSAAQGTDKEETIARLELDWTGWRGHQVEGNVEAALNWLGNRVALFEDRGQGLQSVPLPGGNTEVEELRWEVELADSFQVGGVALEAGLAAEFSRITQSGDAQRERSFSFLKPRLLLTYAPVTTRQVRVRLQREVAQLDFNDFASSTNFADNQFALGNPELGPDNTWVAALSFEQRFGDIGVWSMTAFHHWIEDVQDIVPLGGILEAPGNIGRGRRWGLETNLTFALENLGLAGARIDLSGRWQDSKVIDPVTNTQRYLSNQLRHEFRMEFRQNLSGSTVAWGGMIATASDTPFYGLDELVTTDNIAGTVDMDLFIETTRWWGARTRLQAGNVTNRTFLRDRRVFAGPRDSAPPAFRELRARTRGNSIELSVTGAF